MEGGVEVHEVFLLSHTPIFNYVCHIIQVGASVGVVLGVQ
jgi:hypothetical protein